MGLIGYYLSSFLDFLGLQYISVGLERLILFLTPTFVLLITTLLPQAAHQPQQWMALLTSYGGIVLVFVHDLQGGADIVPARCWCWARPPLRRLPAALRRNGQAPRLAAPGGIRDVRVQRGLRRPVLHPAPGRLLIQPLPVYWLSLVNGIFCTVLPVFMTMIAVQRIGAGTASQAG